AVDDEVARRSHRHEVLDTGADDVEILAPSERPRIIAQAAALAAVHAHGAIGAAHEHEADPRQAGDVAGKVRVARVDLLQVQRLFGVDEVDERIRPGRHDTHPLALERLGSAIDPRAEILVEIVDEALEQAVAAVAAYRLDAAREVTAARPARTDFTHAGGIEELGEQHVFERAPARQLLVRHAVRLPVIGEDVQVVAVLGHAAADARELMDGAIDASERAARP